MKTKYIFTLIALIVLTSVTAFISTQFNFKYVSTIIIGLSALKFGLVSFNFMELNKANTMWKVLIVLYLLIFISVILIVL